MTVRTLSPAHTESHAQPVVVEYTDSFDDTLPDNSGADEYNITPLVTDKEP
jgi:hypothetical protein